MKRDKTEIECIECGKRFWRVIGPKTFEIRCPKCGGYDTEPAEILGAPKGTGLGWWEVI